METITISTTACKRELPSNIKLVSEVQVSDECLSVCNFQGNTYVGIGSTYSVDRILRSQQLQPNYIKGEGRVMGMSVDSKGKLYVLSAYDKPPWTIHVTDLSGKRIACWNHTDTNLFANNLVVTGNQIVVPDRSKQQLTIYSLNGQVIASIPCPSVGIHNTRICSVDGNSVIVVTCRIPTKVQAVAIPKKSTVCRILLSTGEIMWSYTHPKLPGGVVCYGEQFVLVADATYTSAVTITVLNAKTGMCTLQ